MDWNYTSEDWIRGYEESVDHPHRKMILTALKALSPVKSVLELGCSVGPNLKAIHREFPDVTLSGLEPNKDAVEQAKNYVPEAVVQEGDMRDLLPLNMFDVVLADASLMYITPEEIHDVMNRIAVTARRAVVIVERYSPSKLGEVCGGVWGRDYETLLKERGYSVTKTPITEELWPGSPNWAKYGFIFVAVR